jgi:hypothetical protein
MYKILLLLTFFSAGFCDFCIFHVVNKVERKQKITHTVDLDPGQAYKATLKLREGKAKLDVDKVTKKKCTRQVCTFTGTSDMQMITVIGDPGPAIYDLRIYLK